ncbi:MAG: class I SAM-dependent methyltransferase [Theionarchaea archaeon]|nr:class I SAM-dependent methyltransferase [Theionarchaea archaeon]
MADYYSKSLYGKALRKCYDIAPPRVKQYLTAEIQYVIEHVEGCHLVLELGCGYGRVMKSVSHHVGTVVGIDTSTHSLMYGQDFLSEEDNWHMLAMDASQLGFSRSTFDAVVCVQNGLSAFRVDSSLLARESLRVTRPGGLLLYSSYSPLFWEHRLEWFHLQAQHGLIGEIDESRTGNGVIVCKDGLHLTSVTESQFVKLFSGKGTTVTTEEVDGSSIFCQVEVLH